MTNIVTRTEHYVRQHLLKNDASHDFSHIQRVVNMALKLCEKEGITKDEQIEVITLAALLHDVHDYKYSGSESAGIDAISKYLMEQQYSNELIAQIAYIVKNLSFKSELGGVSVLEDDVKPEWKKSLAIVQDADRLDAIGAIGIARCMIYSGAKGNPLYDPEIRPNNEITKKEYMDLSRKSTAINHFYEKLFKLKDLMRTDSGRKIAESRHRFMEAYITQFLLEWDCSDL